MTMIFAKTQNRGNGPIRHDATPARGDTAAPGCAWLEVAAMSMQGRCKALARAMGVAKSAFSQNRPGFEAEIGMEAGRA